MTKLFYYGVEFRDGEDTTTGEPNPRTGRMDRACMIWVFKNKADRDSWVDIYTGKIRKKVTIDQVCDLRAADSRRYNRLKIKESQNELIRNKEMYNGDIDSNEFYALNFDSVHFDIEEYE